jgi:hypothetical protein
MRVPWKRFGEVPHPISDGRQDRLYRTLLAQGDGKKSVDLLETKPGRAVVAVIRSMGEIEDALSHLVIRLNDEKSIGQTPIRN